MAKCVYSGELKVIAKTCSDQVECKTVLEALKKIKLLYGIKAYKIAKSSHILVNGESVTLLLGFKTKLCVTDEVRFVPACAGG